MFYLIMKNCLVQGSGKDVHTCTCVPHTLCAAMCLHAELKSVALFKAAFASPKCWMVFWPIPSLPMLCSAWTCYLLLIQICQTILPSAPTCLISCYRCVSVWLYLYAWSPAVNLDLFDDSIRLLAYSPAWSYADDQVLPPLPNLPVPASTWAYLL